MSELGRSENQKVRVAGVFDQKEVKSRKSDDADDDDEPTLKEASWNGTLQPYRKTLAAIAKMIEENEQERVAQRLKGLHWSLIVSLELQPQGPWYDFIRHAVDNTPFQRTVRKDEQTGKKRKKGTKYVSWNGWPHEEVNKPLKDGKNGLVADSSKERKGHAQLMLTRIPALRVLSVDLGHRYAASCAVWETMTCSQMADLCRAANRPEPTRNDFYIHISRQTDKLQKSGRKRGQPVTETVVCRRIGDDTLPDGGEHPAPWARLDRRFLIKLQGEQKPARWPSDDERDQVNRFAQELGYQRPRPRRARDRRVDELMSDAVRIIRLALRRHGDYARIAFGLTASLKQLPGGRVADKEMTTEELIEQLQSLLMLWYDLAHSTEWLDDWAARQWEDHIANLPGYTEPSRLGEDSTGPQRRKQREQMRQSFKPVAEVLVKDDRSHLADEWRSQWQRNDAAWKPRLKWLRRWLLPRKLGRPPRVAESDEQYRARKARRAAAQNVGGLSLTRIATIRSLYQVFKAYKMRPEPDNLRKNVPAKDDDSLRNFGRRILDAMERMREQRVKQLASRIVEAALGIGSENKWKHWQNGKRPRTRIAEDRFKPCHAIVIENLTNYRPEETRTRRENRQLMSWSSSKVKKYLSEGCQLHGLHLREVSAAYTSRQDSRTGLPGIRCMDVCGEEFRKARHWRTRVRQAADKDDAESRYLLDVDMHSDGNGNAVLRFPLKSGDLFVSVDGRTLQADLNAAANIGLRALLDPDWPGKWWYVPCRADSGKPVADKVKGSAAVDSDQPLAAKTSGKKEKDVVNQWRDCSSEPLKQEQFKSYNEYWNGVRCRVVNSLRKRMEKMLEEPVEA
jgi:IS605 OrfB family transposase